MDILSIFKRKISQKEKQDFLEYVAYQLQMGSSFKSAVIRYIDTDRSKIVLESCVNVINMIDDGNEPAKALFDSGFITKIEFSIISGNTGNVHESILLAVNLNKETDKSANVIKSSIRNSLLILMGLLMLIPLFRQDIMDIYKMFNDMSNMNSTTASTIRLPFLVEYWWSAFVVAFAGFILWMLIKKFINYLYLYHGALYYKIFKFKIYEDLMIILEGMKQLQKSMSDIQSYMALSNTAPNKYWEEFFVLMVEKIRMGGKASESFLKEKGIIPIEVILCFIDGEETNEKEKYLDKASLFCKEKYDVIQQQFRVGIPLFFDLLLYFLIGLVVVKFTNDMNELGIMKVLTTLN
jgi:type II secretory pathway component PulF